MIGRFNLFKPNLASSCQTF